MTDGGGDEIILYKAEGSGSKGSQGEERQGAQQQQQEQQQQRSRNRSRPRRPRRKGKKTGDSSESLPPPEAEDDSAGGADKSQSEAGEPSTSSENAKPTVEKAQRAPGNGGQNTSGSESKNGSRGRRNRGRRSGGPGKNAGAEQKQGKGNKWWRSLTESDPITLEPLGKLRYEPFGIDSSGLGVMNWFDGKILSNYLVSTSVFVNPMTNLPLSRETCVALDLYLIKHKLGKPCVAKMFDFTERKKKDAANNPVPQSVRNLQEEAEAIMNALFSSGVGSATRRREAGPPTPPRNGRRPTATRRPATVLRSEARPFVPGRVPGRSRNNRGSSMRLDMHLGELSLSDRVEEDNLAMIDDDIGLLPYHSARYFGEHVVAEPAAQFPPLNSREEPSMAPREDSQADDPAGMQDAARPNWASQIQAQQATDGGEPASSSSSDPIRLPKRQQPSSSSAKGTGVSSYEKALIDRLESLVVEEPSAMEERRRRKKQLADAFGISDPDRPSGFATSSSSSLPAEFPEDVVEYSTQHLEFVAKVERVVQYFSIQTETKRLALPAMTNMQRKIVHIVARSFDVVSQAYGAEPHRSVNLMKIQGGGTKLVPYAASGSIKTPVKCLSEVVRARIQGVGAGLGDDVGREKWEVKLVDIAPDVNLTEILVWQLHLDQDSLEIEFLKGAPHPKNLRSAILKFDCEKKFEEAKVQLAGGLRGLFVVER